VCVGVCVCSELELGWDWEACPTRKENCGWNRNPEMKAGVGRVQDTAAGAMNPAPVWEVHHGVG